MELHDLDLSETYNFTQYNNTPYHNLYYILSMKSYSSDKFMRYNTYRDVT